MSAASIAAVLTLAVPSVAQLAKTTTIHVAPSSGTTATKFVVSFTAPETTGQILTVVRRNRLTASAPSSAPAHGCVRSVSTGLPASVAGTRVSVTLNPARLGGRRWCKGIWKGTITSTQGPYCPTGQLCPQYLTYRGVVGRFTFRVRAAK